MKELFPMKKRAAPVKLTESKAHLAKNKAASVTTPKTVQTSRLAAAKSNRIPVANSPAKSSATSFLIASSIFEDDDNILEEEFLEAAKDGDFASVERLLGCRSESLFSVDVRDKETGNTALTWAAMRGHKKIVELLLHHCVDITLRNYEGQTALETASPAIQELLLQSVDKGGPHRNLLQAAWQGDLAVVRSILKDFQVDINCTNADGLTPLLLVTRDVQLFEKFQEKHKKVYNPLEVISLLIEHRADPGAIDPDGRTALHYASSSKAAMSMELVQTLLHCSTDAEVPDNRCFKPIHCASQSGNSNVVVALLDGGTDANTRGFAGVTPLHISALNGHDLVCGVLLSKGADITLVDDSGRTAVEVAKTKKVKATLKQAWAEATEKKGTENRLNPVRPPSRGDHTVVKGIITRSKSFNYGNKRKGEVIFDSLQPTGSFENISKKANLLSNGDKAKLAEDRMLRESTDLGMAPFSSFVRGNSKLSPRSPSRSPSRSPPTARKLAPIKISSPRKPNTRREIKFGPGTKSYDGNAYTGKSSTTVASSGGGNGKFQPFHSGLKKCPSDPAKFPGGGAGLPITVLGFELDEHTQSRRSQGNFPTRKGHLRQASDPFTSPTPTPSEGASLPEEFYLRGRSPSHLSVVSMSEDWDSTTNPPPLSSSPPNHRLFPLKTPVTTPRLTLTDSQDDVEALLREKPTHKPQILSLERMQITNRHFHSPALVDPGIYPNSKKLLPPTPVHLDHPTEPEARHPGSKENSPRSDEDAATSRCRSVLRDGNFRIEETQVGSSNDSGLPEDKSSSKSSSVNSSTSTFSNGSPRNHEPVSKSSQEKPVKGKHEVVIKIDGKPTRTNPVPISLGNVQERSVSSKVGAKLEHSLSTQEIEDKYLGALPHSNSTSALSSMVADKSEHTTNEQDRSSGLKSKKNSSFSYVRENTGFLKVDQSKTAPSASKSGSSNIVSRRTSLDNEQNNSTKTSASGVSRSVSNSKELGRQGSTDISAKLKSVAQDNAVKQRQRFSSVPESTANIETKSVAEGNNIKDRQVVEKALPGSATKPSVSSGSPFKRGIKDKGITGEPRSLADKSVQQSQATKSMDRAHSNSENSSAVTRPSQTSAQANSKVGTKSSIGKNRYPSVQSTNTQPHVMQLNSNLTKDTKDKSNSSIAQNKVSSPPTTSVNQSKMTSASTSIRTSHTQASSQERNSASLVAKVIHVQEASESSPHPTSQGSPGSRSSSTAARAVTNRSGANLKSVSNSGQSRQTSGPINSGARSNPRSVSSNVKPVRQSSVPANSSNTQSTVKSKQPVESSKSEPSPPSVSTLVSNNLEKASGSNKKNEESKSATDNKSGPKSSFNSKPKSSYTTTMTMKLSNNSNNRANGSEKVSKPQVVKPVLQTSSNVLNKNGTKDDQNKQPVSPEIFNQGEAPVAPPRRKRSTESRPNSSTSSSSNGSESPPVEYGENYVVSKNGIFTSLSINTLKHGMTPVSSATVPSATGISARKEAETKKSPPARPPLPVSKQVTPKASDSQVSTKFVNRKESMAQPKSGGELNEDHTGPKIVDPFESLNERRIQEIREMVAKEAAEKKEQAPRSGKSRSMAAAKKNDTKEKVERQGSAGKSRRMRQKQPTTGEESKKRPKSSKKRRKGKKKEDTNLSENVENPNVAFIGGINWHFETSCNDRTDVQAVQLRDSSDETEDSDEDINITVHPEFVQVGSKGQINGPNDFTIKVSGTMPGQVSESDHSDSDFEDIPEYAEAVQDEIVYRFGEGFSARSKMNTGRKERNSVKVSRELRASKDKTNDEDAKDPDILPQTNKALSKFDKQVTDDELNDILGSKFPKLYANSKQNGSSDTSVKAASSRTSRTQTRDKKMIVRRNNSMPAERKEATPRIRARARHPSISENNDPEIDEMISEILKNTPDPSMSIGSTKNKRPEQGISREEFADIMNNGGQKSFRELQNSADKKQIKGSQQRKDSESEVPLTARQLLNEPLKGEEEIERMVRNRSHAELQELMEWKNKVDDLNELEKKHLNKLLNTVRNLGLKVNNQASSGNDLPVPKVEENTENVTRKPPVGPMAMRPSEKHALEKSPRFVRKRESFRTANQDKDEVFDTEGHQKFPMDSMSSFGSINIPSVDSEATLVDDRSVVVTSRLGRHSAASSRATVMSDEGDTIQWKRGNILGKGAYGVVWCGLTNHGGLIAVKQIELNIEDMDRTELEYEKIQQEVELLKTLKHQNIVGYLGTSLEDNVVSIFMQFVPGGSIANILARFGALEEEVFSNYTQQILQGVEYLHANSVIHRDIKGGNIMLMHNGIIKLIDFGCAKRLCLNVSTKVTEQSKNRLLKSMRGTPYWMAPEVVKETGYGTSSDIWSIGCTVHEMAMRKPPWADMPQMTAIFNIGNDSKPVPELSDKFTPEARDFARQCMTRDPNHRPSATQLLQHPFMRKRRKSRSNSFANVTEMR